MEAEGWIFMVPCSSSTLTTFGRERGVLVGGVWNGFLLGKVKGQHVPCWFCGRAESDGHLFRDCTFPPLVEIREHPEFHDLVEKDKSHWPGVFSGMVGCFCYLEQLVALPGRRILLRALLISLNVLLARIVHFWFAF